MRWIEHADGDIEVDLCIVAVQLSVFCLHGLSLMDIDTKRSD